MTTHSNPDASFTGVKEVTAYAYAAKCKNNPEVGLVTPETDPEAGKTCWSFDPHRAPELRFDAQSVRQEVERLLAEIQFESLRMTELAVQGAGAELMAAQGRLAAATTKLQKLQALFLSSPWLVPPSLVGRR